jgi:hypothetical protein
MEPVADPENGVKTTKKPIHAPDPMFRSPTVIPLKDK